jgi:hypothetical protein
MALHPGDQSEPVVQENPVIKPFREVEAQEMMDLVLPREEKVGKVGAVENAVLIPFQAGRLEIEPERKVRDEGEGGIQAKPRMNVKQFHELPELRAAHVGDVGLKVGKGLKHSFEVRYTDPGVSHRSRPDMKKNPLLLFENFFVEREKPFIVGVKALHKELQLEAQDLRMFEKFCGHGEGILTVIGVVGGKTVQVRDLVDDVQVPVIQGSRHPLAVGVIGIHDGPDPVLAEIFDTLPVVKLVPDFPAVTVGKVTPDGVKKPVGKEMDVKIDDLFGQRGQ